MNRPILLVLYISLACCIGFIIGAYWSSYYGRDIVVDTIHQHREVEDLLKWYNEAFFQEIYLKELSNIEELQDLEELRKTYAKSGLSSIRMFRETAEKIRKKAQNTKPVDDLEKSIEELEARFKQVSL